MKQINTFEDLAKFVAGVFASDMNDEGFETFTEMARCYCWEWDDIKDEVDSILQLAAARGTECWMWDAQTHIHLGSDDITWRKFKALIFSNLKVK